MSQQFSKQLLRPPTPAARRDLTKPVLPSALAKIFAEDDAKITDIKKRLAHLERGAGIVKAVTP